MAMGVEEQADTYAKEVKGRVDLKDGGAHRKKGM